MITVLLKGGLGNQMFQYAFGRYLAEKNKDILSLDLTFLHARVPFKEVEFRDYYLDIFKINSSITFLSKIKTNSPIMLGISLFMAKFRNILGIQKYINENFFDFNKKALDLKDNIYLNGYWQSHKYFRDIENIIRKEFTLKEPMGEKAVEWKNIIIQSPIPVSLHIRRGDYVYNKKVNLHHGICSISYYKDAVKSLEGLFPMGIILFIFSDDIEWAKENLQFKHKTHFVSEQGIKDYEEMMLMGYCRHHIIANSSFSWWGAWLNNKPNKVVIAPQKWLNDGDDLDLIPESWIRL